MPDAYALAAGQEDSTRRLSRDETIRRENREESQYEVARGAALILAATVDEFRDRLKTQVQSYSQAEEDLRRQLNAARDDFEHSRDNYERMRLRNGAKARDIESLRVALDAANAEIARLAKKARVAANPVPHPERIDPFPTGGGAVLSAPTAAGERAS